MSAPPEANTEYSRGSGPSRRLVVPTGQDSDTPSAARVHRPSATLAVIALGALLGAALVIVSQLTALYHVHSATSSAAIKTVGTGANHAWAPIPLALVAVVLTYPLYRYRSRTAALAIAALGIATLLIVLVGDLPDTHSSGLIGSSAGGYIQATSSPSIGLYMETLGAVLLLAAGGTGFLLLSGAVRHR